MVVSYKRELKHNYLIIEPEEVFYDSYEIKMMAANVIDGLLKFHVKQVDNRKSYYYEITSRQPLSRLLECRNIGAEELKCIITGIARTLGRLDSYLLQEEQILLEPEFIYIEPEQYEISLCLLPGKQGDFPEDMTRLLQYLLGKVDHQDKECVVLAYGLYQESLKDNYGMDDLLKLLVEPSEGKKEMRYEAEKLSEEYDQPETDAVFDSRYQERSRNGYDNRENRHKNQTGDRLVSAAVILGGPLLVWLLEGSEGIRKYWYFLVALDGLAIIVTVYRRLQGKKKGEGGSPENSTAYSERPTAYSEKLTAYSERPTVYSEKPGVPSGKSVVNLENSFSLEKIKNQRKAREKSMPGIDKHDNWQIEFEEDEEAENESTGAGDEIGTVLLTETHKNADMRCLRSMEKGIDDIVIAYVPFIIGKQEGLVDCVLNRDTVSRLHARIDREGEEYTITDLNSTNGIIVGKRTLETNECAVLTPGEEVYIANIGFVFT